MLTRRMEEPYEILIMLQMIRLALTDDVIRELVLDQLDLSEADARRLLARVNTRLVEVRHEPER